MNLLLCINEFVTVHVKSYDSAVAVYGETLVINGPFKHISNQ